MVYRMSQLTEKSLVLELFVLKYSKHKHLKINVIVGFYF